MVEPEGFDVDQNVARFRRRVGALLDRQHLRPTILLDHDRPHGRLSSLLPRIFAATEDWIRPALIDKKNEVLIISID
jgi:hypothetical protein